MHHRPNKAGIPSKTTGIKAINDLLSAGLIERIGKGGKGDAYRYFALHPSPSGARFLRHIERLQPGREPRS